MLYLLVGHLETIQDFNITHRIPKTKGRPLLALCSWKEVDLMKTKYDEASDGMYFGKLISNTSIFHSSIMYFPLWFKKMKSCRPVFWQNVWMSIPVVCITPPKKTNDQNVEIGGEKIITFYIFNIYFDKFRFTDVYPHITCYNDKIFWI